MSNNTTFLLFYYTIGFCFILFLAYYVTKFIAKKTNNVIYDNNIKVIQNIRIDRNNRIIIIIIYSKLYVLGISNNNINLIDKYNIKGNKGSIDDVEKSGNDTFEQYLNSHINTKLNYHSNNLDNVKNKIENIKNKLIKLIKKGDMTSDKEDKYEKKN